MRGKVVPFTNFAGGIDTPEYFAGGVSFEDNQPRIALNVVSTGNASLIRRDGCANIARPGGAVEMDGLVTGISSNAKSVVALAQETASGKLYTVNLITGATALILTLPSTGRWEWVTAPLSGGQGPLYGSNGTDVLYYVTGAPVTWTASTGTLHPCKYLAYAGNRVWMTGDPNFPSRVYFSNLADPRDWPAANVFDLDPEDGQPITGIAAFGPYVIVSKERKLWAIYDLDSGANRKISNAIGAVSHRTMKTTPAGLFFLSRLGIYATDGGTVKPITKHLRMTNDQSKAAAGYWDDRYFVSLHDPASGVVGNTFTYEWNLTQGNLWTHNVGANQFSAYSPLDTTDDLFGVQSNGYVAQMFQPGVTTDNGSAFTGQWRGPWWEMGSPRLRKRCRGVVFDGAGTLSTVGVAKDYETSPTTVGSSLVMQSGPAVAPARLPGLGVARAWSLDVQATSAFEIRAILMAMQSRAD